MRTRNNSMLFPVNQGYSALCADMVSWGMCCSTLTILAIVIPAWASASRLAYVLFVPTLQQQQQHGVGWLTSICRAPKPNIERVYFSFSKTVTHVNWGRTVVLKKAFRWVGLRKGSFKTWQFSSSRLWIVRLHIRTSFFIYCSIITMICRNKQHWKSCLQQGLIDRGR